ncbi:Ff.00g104960.m01.CDS01 [Fusarium sp. VM40]|nr:Ff.00g104960.m01.CDS01 [Fusarium sp. VM40]
MSNAREHWGLSCTTGGRFYICEDDDTQFIGCCLSDPCGRNNGTCPDGDLRATTFASDTYADLPAQDCDNSQGVDNWYTCAYTTPPFLGCCSQNACGSGCPRNRLVPAKLSKNENNRLNFLNPRESGSTTSSTASETASATASSTTTAASGTSATASSTSAVEAGDDGGLGTGAVAGIAVGAAVGGLIILILLFWLFWWKPREKKKQQSGTSVAHYAPPAAPAMSQSPYSPTDGSFHQVAFKAQSPMSGYQQSFASTPTVPSHHHSGVSPMDRFQEYSPNLSQSDRPQSYGHFTEYTQNPGLPHYQQVYNQHQIPVVSEMDGITRMPQEMSAGSEHRVQRNSSIGPEVLDFDPRLNAMK